MKLTLNKPQRVIVNSVTRLKTKTMKSTTITTNIKKPDGWIPNKKQPCRATGAMPLLQWFLELFGYKPKDKFATPKKKKRPSKYDINEFQMFWDFFHDYSFVNRLNKSASRRIWDDMPRRKKDLAYSLDKVIMYRHKNIQCDEYLRIIDNIITW